MSKRKPLAKSTLKRGKKIAEKLKGKKGIRNPFAVGIATAKKRKKKSR